MNYQFIFDGGTVNSYFFETNSGIIYQIKFKPTPYLFGNDFKEISEYIYEFAILVEYNVTEKLPSNDKK